MKPTVPAVASRVGAVSLIVACPITAQPVPVKRSTKAASATGLVPVARKRRRKVSVVFNAGAIVICVSGLNAPFSMRSRRARPGSLSVYSR